MDDLPIDVKLMQKNYESFEGNAYYGRIQVAEFYNELRSISYNDNEERSWHYNDNTERTQIYLINTVHVDLLMMTWIKHLTMLLFKMTLMKTIYKSSLIIQPTQSSILYKWWWFMIHNSSHY